MPTYIIGHLKPDLDSVVAPLAAAELLKDYPEWNQLTPVIADEINNETKFVFEKFNAKLPQKITASNIKPKDKIILVDHNEPQQRLENLPNEQIELIYDHHMVKVDFPKPIWIYTMPWGSTCTILWNFFQLYKKEVPQDLAKLMLAAVLSDTVGLKSAITTDKDKKAVSSLAKTAGITDIDSLTLEIFKAKSNIDNLTPVQIVTNDYKIYNFSGKKVLISQIETVEQEKVLAKKQALLKAMENTKAEQKVDYLFVIISDVLKVNSKILYPNDQEKQIAEKAFGTRGEANVLDIGPKLSRKKEIAPEIEKAIKS